MFRFFSRLPSPGQQSVLRTKEEQPGSYLPPYKHGSLVFPSKPCHVCSHEDGGREPPGTTSLAHLQTPLAALPHLHVGWPMEAQAESWPRRRCGPFCRAM